MPLRLTPCAGKHWQDARGVQTAKTSPIQHPISESLHSPQEQARASEMDSARRTSARLVEELSVAADESEDSRSGGQKKQILFDFFIFVGSRLG
jgi:hypothetical protein